MSMKKVSDFLSSRLPAALLLSLQEHAVASGRAFPAGLLAEATVTFSAHELQAVVAALEQRVVFLQTAHESAQRSGEPVNAARDKLQATEAVFALNALEKVEAHSPIGSRSIPG